MAFVKLCGLMRPEDVRAAALVRADYMGFVLAKSRRRVRPEDVAAWTQEGRGPALPKPVLVLVDPDEDEVLRLAEQTGVHRVQLSGDESPDLCGRLRVLHGVTVWKAWGVRGDEQDRHAERYAGTVDAFLLDTHRTDARGGTGAAFAWESIPGFRERLPGVPLVVAGGLTAETVPGLIEKYRPDGVDVSSGIETAGWKDPKKMRRFMAAAANFQGV